MTNPIITKNHELLSQFLRYPEIAERLGVSINCIKNWQAKSYKGFPKARYLGRCAIFKENEIAIWAKNALTDTSPDGINRWGEK